MLDGYGTMASMRKRGGAGGDDDGPLRPLWESEGSKKGNVALGGSRSRAGASIAVLWPDMA